MTQSKLLQPKLTTRQKVDLLLIDLPSMDRPGLQQLWREHFCRPPSSALRRETLIPILAYRIQEKAFGGLKESTLRKLREFTEERTGGGNQVQSGLRPKTGTRYVREYEGKLHEVTVLELGYEYGNHTYRSLTEIAKVITGTKWSGPAFFGLKRKARSVNA